MLVTMFVNPLVLPLCFVLPMVALISPPGTIDRGGYLSDLD
jgi:hypothetical protein